MLDSQPGPRVYMWTRTLLDGPVRGAALVGLVEY